MSASGLELWGGAECTVNRVHDRHVDQLVETGHDTRAGDLAQLAGLNLAALRFPLLWERIEPGMDGVRDWRWADGRLAQLRALGIRPIGGLVHHGSGPHATNLLADDFAPGLARHTRAAAERYPWITDWTPVNEPLTTARFSALYGHWYPHRRDERSFWRALLNQIDGVRLSMAAIREVVPGARLIQTDDLGRTYATATMRDQAAFDNVRRWMGWDLLCGRVTPGHPFWARLCGYGFEARLRAIADAPCPPDIVGVNHYLTSDRFLDHRIGRYPQDVVGGADRRFADVEAVRVLQPHPPGFSAILREAWSRYRIPVALTEVHNGCTRDEQMRWLSSAWHAAETVRAEGVDVRAVTAWSLFGSRGWDRLLTGGGRYETGAFDVRSGVPRRTAMVPLLSALGAGGEPGHPVLDGAGWWVRPVRLMHPVVPRAAPIRDHGRARDWRGPARAPILITGATGTLGRALAAACRHRDIACVVTTRDDLDLSRAETIDHALDLHRPWAVINAAGWVRVDEAEGEAEACHRANAEGAVALARAAAARDIACALFSTDLLFDGAAAGAVYEDDPVAPLGVYGASKAAMERGVGDISCACLIIRTAAFFSPFDPHNFASGLVERLAEGKPFEAADDHVVSPTYVPYLCDAVLDLLIDGATGVHHLTHAAALSWAEFGRRLAVATGFDPELVRGVPGDRLGWRAPRPKISALASRHGALLPPLAEAIAEFARAHPRSAAAIGSAQSEQV